MTQSPSRTNVAADTPWASVIGYSRAVRVGTHVFVAQTSSADKRGIVQGGSDPYLQGLIALGNVEAALVQLGARLADVVRTRMYVATFSDWPEVARAHAEVFGEVRPAVSLLTCPMVSPEILVEFEADAIVSR
jgi:enamine deaminase RidA (YjgF/YER057c/UK114 family)